MMKRVLIITGPAGDAQGWGDLKVTQSVCQAIQSKGKSAEIAYVESLEEFKKAVRQNRFDIIWSALYHASSEVDFIGLSAGDDAWLADYLDAWQMPYIGPNALTMKQLIQKYDTHRILKQNGVAVPRHFLVGAGDPLPQVAYPAFVKPSTESRSVGISDNSVADSPEALQKQIDYILATFKQPALVEEYLPGEEYTVLMLGNGRVQEFLPGIVKVDAAHYGKYPILRSDLRGVGLTKIYRPTSRSQEAVALCKQATDALNCWDHVRVDMRVAGDERLKIIEVNGIPGLKPIKSWSPQIYTLYHASPLGPDEDYRSLIDFIVESALARHNLS
jgi:D-alanine-D-alanine ligase